MRLVQEGVDCRVVLQVSLSQRVCCIVTHHVLEQSGEIQHLLGKTVQRFCHARFEVAEPLVGGSHILIILR